MNAKHPLLRLAATCLALLPLFAMAQSVSTVSDTFTGASSSFNWTPLQGACLTAGDATGTVPACKCPAGVTTNCLSNTGGYLATYNQTLDGGYSGNFPGTIDSVGTGALRLTSGRPNRLAAGGLLSNFVFPSTDGLKVTFTTYSYHGDSGGSIGDGADGMSFFLLDASSSTWTPSQIDIGVVGGSLGATCSNTTYNYKSTTHPNGTLRGLDGAPGVYVALGIDEYGNFSNPGDNTASGPGVRPNSVLVRGPGNVSWAALNAAYPSFYPSGLPDGSSAGTRGQAVQKTCSTGHVWDFSNLTTYPNGRDTGNSVADYQYLAGISLSTATSLIANESTASRSAATPIQYTLTITPAGLLSLSYSYNGGATTSVISNTDITAGGTYPIPSKFAFGFAGSIGGSSNIHEVTCFKAAAPDTSASSAGLNERQSAEVQLGTQVYFAFYDPNTWAGALVASPLLASSTGVVSIGTPLWDASCVLTGTAAGTTCATTGLANVAAETPASRTILTWRTDTRVGTGFSYANLSTAQQSALSSSCTNYSSNACQTTTTSSTVGGYRVAYLRGDRTNEAATSTTYLRPRASVLGDIVDSSPTWVGPPQNNYPQSWADKINGSATLPENSGTSYPSWQSSVVTRTNVVYTGANDGMLHGFRAGSYSNVTTYNTATTVNDGREIIAYLPGNMIADGSSAIIVNGIHDSTTSPTLDYSSPNYAHNFFLDAPPGTGDLFYGGSWHTWIVGGLGAGGAGIYALDVTDPTQFSEANASSLVMGEWTSSTISCNIGGGGCGNNLGNTYGTPQIRRFHNGQWGAVFGNGFGSSSGDAGIYIMLIDPTTHAVTFNYYSTGSSGSNGIAYTTPADLDGDHIVDYIYAGDLKGHLWRFDVTNASPSNWALSGGGAIFTTPSGQPITTRVVVASSPSATGGRRIVVSFGTGRQIPFTSTTATTYATGTQSLYGIWDWNMDAWNAKGSTQYASLAGSSPNQYSSNAIAASGTGANLQVQTLSDLPSVNGKNYRGDTSTPVCWSGSTTCSSGNTQFGWYVNLPGSQEQIIFNPVLQLGAFVVNSTIPAASNPASCTTNNASGWTYAISPTTGGSLGTPFFNPGGVVDSGVQDNGTGSPSFVTTAFGTTMVTQTTSGSGVANPVQPPTNAKATRLTWTELR